MSELCDCPRCQLKHGTRPPPPATVTLPRSVVDEVRRALEPWEKYLGLRGSAEPDDTLMDETLRNCQPKSSRGPTLGDCRRAAAALTALAAAMEGK